MPLCARGVLERISQNGEKRARIGRSTADEATEIVAAVEGFDGPGVLLADGTRIQPDVVIAATGYRRGLEPVRPGKTRYTESYDSQGRG